jgi:hypothetical protein
MKPIFDLAQVLLGAVVIVYGLLRWSSRVALDKATGEILAVLGAIILLLVRR